MSEWIVKSKVYRFEGEALLVVDHFNDERALREFCHEGDPDDIVSVWRVEHYELSIEDVTDKYVPNVAPSRFDCAESEADRIYDESKEEMYHERYQETRRND